MTNLLLSLKEPVINMHAYFNLLLLFWCALSANEILWRGNQRSACHSLRGTIIKTLKYPIAINFMLTFSHNYFIKPNNNSFAFCRIIIVRLLEWNIIWETLFGAAKACQWSYKMVIVTRVSNSFSLNGNRILIEAIRILYHIVLKCQKWWTFNEIFKQKRKRRRKETFKKYHFNDTMINVLKIR